MTYALGGLTVLALCAAQALAVGINGPPKNLVVFDPTITNPTAKTVWVVGNTYNVTWETDNLPPLVNITNVVGMVVLGQFDGADGSENLDLDHPLVPSVLLTDGGANITVPKTPDGEYTIVVFGSANNASPAFKIVNNPLSSLAPPPSSAASGASSSSGGAPGSATSGSTSPSNTSSSVPLLSTLFPSIASGTSPAASQTASDASSTTPAPSPTSNGAFSIAPNGLGIFGLAAAVCVLSIPFLP